MPSFLNVIRTAESSPREFLFQQLATLIVIVKQHIRNYLEDIFNLIKVLYEGTVTMTRIHFVRLSLWIYLQEFWVPGSSLQSTLILLVEHIAMALGSEFRMYLPHLMPLILRVFTHDTSKDRSITIKVCFKRRARVECER